MNQLLKRKSRSAALPEPTVTARHDTSEQGILRVLAQLLMPILSLVVLIAVFSIANHRFLSLQNGANILEQSAILLVAAVAGTIVIVAGSLDLSVGSMITLSGMGTAFLLPKFGLWAVAIGIGIGIGGGLLNGAAFVGLKVPSFLVTLGTLSLFDGIANIVSNGQPVIIANSGFNNIAQAKLIPGMANLVLWSLLVWVLAIGLMFFTSFGRRIFAIGAAEPVARLAGVKTARYKILAFAVSGMIAAIAGILLTSQLGSATPGMGSPLLLDSIAAVVMGGTGLAGGSGGPHRTIIGTLIIGILLDGMVITNVNAYVQEVITGSVVVLAVAMTTQRKRIKYIK